MSKKPKPLLTIFVGREPVQTKLAAGNAKTGAGTLDRKVSIDLSAKKASAPLQEILTKYGYTVWQCAGTRNRVNCEALNAIAIDFDDAVDFEKVKADFARTTASLRQHHHARQRMCVCVYYFHCVNLSLTKQNLMHCDCGCWADFQVLTQSSLRFRRCVFPLPSTSLAKLHHGVSNTSSNFFTSMSRVISSPYQTHLKSSQHHQQK